MIALNSISGQRVARFLITKIINISYEFHMNYEIAKNKEKSIHYHNTYRFNKSYEFESTSTLLLDSQRQKRVDPLKTKKILIFK